MPPEMLQALLSAGVLGSGRLGSTGSGFSAAQGTSPGFPDPFTRPSFSAQAQAFPQPQAQPQVSPQLDLSQFNQLNAGGLGGVDDTRAIPDPLDTRSDPEGGFDVGGFLAKLLGGVVGGLGGGGGASGVARQRLGGSPAPGIGGGAPGGGGGFGGLPGIRSVGGGAALNNLGQQQQADVANQQQLAASSLGSLLGGAGGFK